MTKRNNIIPNERRRQTWRKHRLNLIDRRSKWFYQQQTREEEARQAEKEGREGHAETVEPSDPQERT